MCYNPITIPNPSKFISTKFRNRFMLQVPCGSCAECQEANSNEWYYRTYHEFFDCLRQKDSFILFDTLTYSNDFLPRMSDFISVPVDLDFPCFNSRHIKKFRDLLSKRLKRAGYDLSIRYFLSSEYGTDPYRSHRPHYHVLFFVVGKIDPLEFSKYVSDCWKFGRTDGVFYKSNYYVLNHNVITSSYDTGSLLRVCKYVTKYVQKSCEFQVELDRRLQLVSDYVCRQMENKIGNQWSHSEHKRRLLLRFRRYICQFHRQSKHFGESALMGLDIDELFRDGCLYMPDFQGVKIPLKLPTYYKRKLFYDLCEFNGCKCWVLNDLGVAYNNARKDKLMRNLSDRYYSLSLQGNFQIDCDGLADYVLNKRGRFVADRDEATLDLFWKDIDFYSYVTCSDKEHYNCRSIVTRFVGSSSNRYKIHSLPYGYSISKFIKKFVYFDFEKEKILDSLAKVASKINDKKSDAWQIEQKLRQKYKMIT